MVGREFVHWNGTPMLVVEDLGNAYRVKNLAAGHISLYSKEDFKKMKKTETKESISRQFKKYYGLQGRG